MGPVLRPLGCISLAGMLMAAPAMAQVVPLPSVVPAAPQANSLTAPTTVSSDPYRVFGDDAPVFAGLGVLGGIGFSITGSLTAEYSDNVARVADNGAISDRYRSKDDWIFRPTVSVNLNRPVGRQSLFLTGNIGRNIYARNTTLNGNRFSVGAGANLALGTRCGGQVKGGYSNRETQFGTFELVIPSKQERVTFGANATCRTTGGLTGSLGYSWNKAQNHTDDPLSLIDRSFADVTSNSLNGSLGYALGARGQVGIQGFWSENNYPNQFLPTGGTNANKVVGGSVFASYRVGTSLRASGSLGKTEVRTQVPGAAPFSGGTWNLSLDYTGPRLGATIATGRSVNAGSGGSANYTVGTFFNGSVSYRANSRMTASTGVATSNSDYRGIVTLPETAVVRSAKNTRLFLGGDYRMNQILSFSVDLNHQKRSSRPSAFNYDENSIMFGIRARF